MLFRIQIPMQVERSTDELADLIETQAELACRGGKWQGVCRQPPVSTDYCDSLDEALKSLAKEIVRDAETPQLGAR